MATLQTAGLYLCLSITSAGANFCHQPWSSLLVAPLSPEGWHGYYWYVHQTAEIQQAYIGLEILTQLARLCLYHCGLHRSMAGASRGRIASERSLVSDSFQAVSEAPKSLLCLAQVPEDQSITSCCSSASASAEGCRHTLLWRAPRGLLGPNIKKAAGHDKRSRGPLLQGIKGHGG